MQARAKSNTHADPSKIIHSEIQDHVGQFSRSHSNLSVIYSSKCNNLSSEFKIPYELPTEEA